MTKIQLRRDTLVNFTSKNPILAEGELAYETDTKKLKIGDGTTAYNSLAYFTTGGGTTDITASLPLVLNEGVLSLQIDGQTLQVNTEGKLAANLDELGNEVNDLSGRVTAVEADVLQKQNVIATNAPLQLTESSSIELKSDKLSYDNSTGILSYASGTQEDAAARIDLSRLHLKTHEPYTLHLRAARAQTSATGNSNFFRLQCYNDGTDTTFRGVRVWNGGGTGRAGGTNTVVKALILNSKDYVHYEFRYDGTNGISEYRGRNNETTDATRLAINTFTDQAGDYSKFENEFTQLLLNCYYGYAGKFDLSQSYIEQNNVRYILKDVVAEGISTLQLNTGDGLLVVDGKLTATGGGDVTASGDNTFTGKNTFNKIVLSNDLDGVNGISLAGDSNASIYNAGKYLVLRKVNTITGGGGNLVLGDATVPTILRGSVVKTETNGKIYLNQGNVTAGDNVTIEETTNGVKISSTGGGGSEPPANMVTTDTAQTITGAKTFGGTDLSKILLEGSESLIGFRANADSLSTTLIGGFFDSNGKKSITIGSTDHETLSLNAKSVQDASGNKFLTSGNVTAYITETYVNGTSGYRIWSDGYCEQWGRCNSVAYNVATKNVTFLKTFKDTNYFAVASPITDATNDTFWNISARVAGFTTTQMTVRGGFNANGAWTGVCSWMACGYLASGQY